jgi:hypothetical protein
MSSGSFVIKSPSDFANALIGELNQQGASIPDGPNQVADISAWEQQEGGNWKNDAKFNPLNTTLGEPGSVSINSSGVQAYNSWAQGLDATTSTLMSSSYQSIINTLAQNDSFDTFAQAVDSSSWGTKGLGSLNSPTPSSSNNSAYVYGTQTGQNGDNAINSPSNTTTPLNLTGLAGVLQQMDSVFNPHQSSSSQWWNINQDISSVSKGIGSSLIMIFARLTGVVAGLILIKVSIDLISSGATKSNGIFGGGSGNNVFEFIAQTNDNNRKAEEFKIRSSLKEAELKTKKELQESRERSSKAREEAHNIRNTRYATINETHARNREREINRKMANGFKKPKVTVKYDNNGKPITKVER